MRNNYTKEQLITAIENNKSIAGVLRDLNLRPVGGNYSTIKRLVSKHQLDTSHFTGQGWNVGLKFRPQKTIPISEIFIQNSSYRSMWRLKNKLFELGYKQKFCEVCKQSKWLNKEIPLEIHHINGDNLDHRLENLQILCPNCHALTENYRGRHKLSALSEKREVEYRKFRESLTDNADGNPEPSLF